MDRAFTHDKGDTPEGVLDGRGHGLAGVGGLGGSKADELGTSKRKGSSDEHGTDTLEAVGKCTGVLPQGATDVVVKVTSRGATAADADNADNQENDDHSKLEARRPEFFLGISKSAENGEEDDNGPEDGDPDTERDGIRPVLNGATSDSNFEREDNGPLEDIYMVSRCCDMTVRSWTSHERPQKQCLQFQPIAKANEGSGCVRMMSWVEGYATRDRRGGPPQSGTCSPTPSSPQALHCSP